MKALVVEDNEFYRRQVAERFSDYGIESSSAGSLQEAVTLTFDQFDVLVVDVMLPNDPTTSGVSDIETRGGTLAGLCLARIARKKNPGIKVIFISGTEWNAEVEDWSKKHSAKLISKGNAYKELNTILNEVVPGKLKDRRNIFIVHGHDDAAIFELKDFLQNTLGLQEPIVLRDTPSLGRVVIEKFEDYAEEMDVVFVLLTPDDVGRKFNTNDERRRARQNVIFELGYFYGKIGRKTGKVIALARGSLELPSDIAGLVWINIDHGIKSAGEEIRIELKQLGLS